MDGEQILDVDRSIHGDREAFNRLIRSFRASVRGFLFKRVGDYHTAQDLTQETFLKAFVSLENLESPCSFRSWLFRIAFHVAIDYLRARECAEVSLDSMEGFIVPSGTEAAPTVMEETDERTKKLLAVSRALTSVPEQYGILLVLRYLQQRSYAELSRLLDLSLSNVKVRLYRARKMIRARVSDGASNPRIVQMNAGGDDERDQDDRVGAGSVLCRGRLHAASGRDHFRAPTAASRAS